MSRWDTEAPLYSMARRLPGLHWILAAEQRGLRALLSSLTLHGGTVLDVGCGDAEGLRLIDASCVRIGLDRSHRFAVRARRIGPAITVVADMAALPCRSTSIDLVLCIGLLEYSQDLGTTITELVRVTRPGGYLLLTCSPAGPLTTARHMLGHSITPMTGDMLIARCELLGLRACLQQRFRSQHQVLLQK